jgi:hypothetical protein
MRNTDDNEVSKATAALNTALDRLVNPDLRKGMTHGDAVILLRAAADHYEAVMTREIEEIKKAQAVRNYGMFMLATKGNPSYELGDPSPPDATLSYFRPQYN